MKHAFLFQRWQNGKSWYVVDIAKNTDFTIADTGWMDNPELPAWEEDSGEKGYFNGTLQLDIDQTESIHKFDTLEEAENFLATHYTTQAFEKYKQIIEKM